MTVQEVIDFLISKDSLPTWSTILGTFFGARFGSRTAFKLEGKRRKAEEKTRHLAAANHALCVISQYCEFLEMYKNSLIDPKKGNYTIQLINPIATINPTPTDKLNLPELQFLLQANRKDLYLNLIKAEVNFNTSIMLIENRKKLLDGIDLSKFYSIEPDRGLKIEEKELIEIFGAHVIYQSKTLGREIIGRTEESLKGLKAFYPILRAGITQILQTDKLITIPFDSDGSEKSSSSMTGRNPTPSSN
ncbi:hypothetical protein [Pseudogulbenkiania ferrooxidans]|uniref:hypothetical protein n=1 Tax=Pseudogulbenkiania ferrooxidans TaxID=549169 RepID=UPI0003F922B7|nr:hypothetical protein [Pseudogulbenkiania ferrooxidans]